MPTLTLAGDDRMSLRLPGDARGVREARGFVRDRLAAWHLADLADDASLIVTELATNAVVHAHSSYTVTAWRQAGAVRLEVRDQGPDREPGAVRARGWTDHGLGGRGLALVDALSREWGVRSDGSGTTVWVELAA